MALNLYTWCQCCSVAATFAVAADSAPCAAVQRPLLPTRLLAQEIYGLEQSVAAARAGAAAGADNDADNEERLCVICLVNERDTTVLPCRHM